MSGFYGLISKAIKDLDQNTVETRQNLYRRAREALISHASSPDGMSLDLASKLNDLDAAVALVERELSIGANSPSIAGAAAALLSTDAVPPPDQGHPAGRSILTKAETLSNLAGQLSEAGRIDNPVGVERSVTADIYPEVDKPQDLDSTDLALKVERPHEAGVASVASLGEIASNVPTDQSAYAKKEIGKIISYNDQDRSGFVAILGKPNILFEGERFRGQRLNLRLA